MRVAWGNHQAMERLPTTRAALAYAGRVHAGQVRKADAAPFINHPREVAMLLYRAGAPDHLIAAGLLHDVLEKTAAAPSDLRERFGGKVTALVLAVSKDENIAGYRPRKAALRQQVASAGNEALMLFAADKISKVRELRLGDSAAGAGPRGFAPSGRKRARRIEHYGECLTLLRQRLPESPLVEQLEAELQDLSAGTPHRAVPVG